MQNQPAQQTYDTIAAGVEDLDAAFGGQRLRARDDALGAVDDAAPARELGEGVRGRREHGGRGEGHREEGRSGEGLKRGE